jgi:hypothetical protein
LKIVFQQPAKECRKRGQGRRQPRTQELRRKVRVFPDFLVFRVGVTAGNNDLGSGAPSSQQAVVVYPVFTVGFLVPEIFGVRL